MIRLSKLLIGFLIVFLVFVCVNVRAAVLTFENTTNKKAVYILYWVDHFFNSNRPSNVAAGEFGPETQLGCCYTSKDYPGRFFYLIVFQRKRDGSEVRDEKAIIVPEKKKSLYYIWDGKTIKLKE